MQYKDRLGDGLSGSGKGRKWFKGPTVKNGEIWEFKSPDIFLIFKKIRDHDNS